MGSVIRCQGRNHVNNHLSAFSDKVQGEYPFVYHRILLLIRMTREWGASNLTTFQLISIP